MKPKNLSKKIRRLEARLQKGAKKLAKLKQKLEAAPIAGAAKKKRKLAVTPESRMRAAAVKRPSTAKREKRKLNLTPERRAELAAAMKARWAAKRAAADSNTQTTSTEQGFAPGQDSHPQ